MGVSRDYPSRPPGCWGRYDFTQGLPNHIHAFALSEHVGGAHPCTGPAVAFGRVWRLNYTAAAPLTSRWSLGSGPPRVLVARAETVISCTPRHLVLYTHFGSSGSGTDSVSRASGTTWAPPPPSRASSPSPLPLSRSRVTTWLSRAALLPGGKEVSTSPGREEGVCVTPREATPRLQPAAGRSCAVQVSALRRLSCGDPRTAQHVPHAARAFGPGAPNPRATTDGGQHFFQAGKRCHSLRAGRRRLCNTTGLNFATTGIPGLPSTCRTQHVPSAQVLLTPVLRLTAGSTSSRQEEGVTPSGREGGVYVTPVVTGWPPLQMSVFSGLHPTQTRVAPSHLRATSSGKDLYQHGLFRA